MVMRMYAQHSVAIAPNVMPNDWWECDVLQVSKANIATEFEVKLSASDFRSDAKKDRCTGYLMGERQMQTKYDALQAGKGPNKFYYVMPKGLVPLEQIPDFAGVIYFDTVYPKPRYEGADPKPYIQPIPSLVDGYGRVAPSLHKDKRWAERMVKKIHLSAYYRFLANFTHGSHDTIKVAHWHDPEGME